MKKILFIIATVLSGTLLNSCYKDKGNYDYFSVSDITISNVESKYVQVTELDILKINPKIASAYDTTQFEYIWSRYDSKRNLDTISRSKNLSFAISGMPENYTLMFSVKNKENGLGSNVQTELEVVSPFSKGHYILKETAEGNTEIDLLREGDDLVENVLFTTQGSPLQGKPRSMGILYENPMIDPETLARSTANCIGLITYGKQTSIFRLADMYKVNDHSTMFYGEPDDVPYHFYTNYNNSIYLSSAGLHSISGPGVGKYGPPSSAATGGSEFRTLAAANIGFVYWDEIGRRILFHNYTSTPQVVASATFPTTNLNYKCIFMGNYAGVISGRPTSVIFILFRDLTDPGKLVLYRMTGDSPFSAPTVASVTTLNSTSKMHTATHFASNERSAQIIYFVADNKPYYFDPATQTETSFSPQGLPADEEVTYISNRFDYYDSSRINYFTVATFKNGTYKVYMYNMIGGLPYGAPVKRISGIGKVKETHHVTTTFSPISEGNVNVGYSR